MAANKMLTAIPIAVVVKTTPKIEAWVRASL